VVIFFAHTGPAAAQVQTFSYQGQAFNPANCVDDPDHTFVSGNITSSVTFVGLSSSYSGTIASPSANLSSLSSTANGLGLTLDLSVFDSASFLLSGGQITSWGISLSRSDATSSRSISSNGTVGSTGNDGGSIQTSPPVHTKWGCNYLLGQWSNPKSADSERNRPSFRFQIARHSEMKSPTIPR